MRNCGCNDYSRTQLLRRAAAEAGRGLPAIEPGMPMPAGTGLTRRSFVSRATGLALSVYGAASLGPKAFEEGIAAAAAQAPSERVLVSIFLSGGADSLTMLAPTAAHPQYAAARPTLALPAGQGTPLTEDSSLRWHPSLGGLAELYGEGKVSVMPAIGYDDANQSHFTSRHYWEVGEVNPFGRWGWLGRYLDHHGVADNPLQGLALGWDLQPVLAARDVPVADGGGAGQLRLLDARACGGRCRTRCSTRSVTSAIRATSDIGLGQARAAVAATGRLRDQLAPFQGGFTTPGGVTYPNGGFARRLQALAAMLDGGLPLKVVAIESGGYDTHSNQADSLPADLLEIGDSLRAFQRDLEARTLQDRVLVHVWSEFGRRPDENGSGTDHGAAGAGFVIGSQARGEMVGEFPGLATLDEDDNLRNTSDFRGVYCALLEQWLGVDAGPIIPNASSFTRPALVAA